MDTRTLQLEANGLRFPALTAGPDSGSVALCLHGFPDTHHGFFEALGQESFSSHLVQAGYRVVAPAMRGLAASCIPQDGAYAPSDLAQDVIAHATSLGGKVALIANDWGAFAAYLAAVQRPDLFTHLVTLGIPHPLSIKPSLGMLWKARHFIAFQFQSRAAKALRKDDCAGIEVYYKRWSPTWKYPPAALAEVKRAYAQPGIAEGALAPYKAMRTHKKATDSALRGKIMVPTLALGGGGDPTVPSATYEAARRGFGARYEWDLVGNVGHFPQREDPAATATRVLAFLRGG
jgi:pimeloyl-ACP methyl ester carboxylesterase